MVGAVREDLLEAVSEDRKELEFQRDVMLCHLWLLYPLHGDQGLDFCFWRGGYMGEGSFPTDSDTITG